MECNLTIKCVGNCKPKDVIGLFERSFAKVTVYKETDPNGKTHRKPERGITTTKPHEWVLKVYDKTFQQRQAGNLKVESNLIRVELVFLDRMLDRMYSTKKSLEDIQTRFSHGTAWQGDLSNGGNLFIQADGKLMGHTTPYQYFTKHLHRYNEWVQNNPDKAKAEGLEELPIIPLHGLRHSCATLLNYLEVNIIEISKTLGHSTCSTTMNIYAHSFEEQQEEVATKVNEFLRLNA